MRVCVCECVLFICDSIHLHVFETCFYKYKVLKIAVKQLKEGREDERKTWSVKGGRNGAIFPPKSGGKVKIKNPSGVFNLFFTI